MNVELLTEHHLEILSLKGGCTGSSESTLVKILHFWKAHVMAHLPLHEILVLIAHASTGFIQASLCKIQGLFKDF